MNQSPGFKVVAPIAAIYAMCLFMPTIDALATFSVELFSYKMKISIAVLLFPAIYPLSDSLTEVYGKNVSYYITFFCYIVIIVFSLLNNVLLRHIDNKQLFSFLIQPSLIITIAGPISYIITSMININLLYKLKIRMRNSHFIIRSFVCSAICGFVMSAIVQGALCMRQGFSNFMQMFLTIFIMKLIVTIPYVYLAKILVCVFRYVDDIELNTYNKNLVMNN